MELHTERCTKSAWDHFLLIFISSRLAFALKICIRLVYCELIDDSFYLHLTYLLLRIKQGQLTAGSLGLRLSG